MANSEKICVAYTGSAVNDGTMNVNQLSPALLALSNLIGESNRILNRDDSTVEVRLSSHLERGSFEMFFEIARSFPDQLKLFFTQNYSVLDILAIIGFASTVTGINSVSLFQFILWLKNRHISKVEKSDSDKVKIFVQNDSIVISILSWNLFSSQKVRSHIEGIVQPLKQEGVDSFEIRDKFSQEKILNITSDEVEYFSDLTVDEDFQEIKFSSKLMLKIVNVTFERNLKWRFDDGDSKFFADVKDEVFLNAVENGKISFTQGDIIFAELETIQQYAKTDLKKTAKTITCVFKVIKKIDDTEIIFHEI